MSVGLACWKHGLIIENELGGGIECLFVQKITLLSQEEIREEQTGKCLRPIW